MQEGTSIGLMTVVSLVAFGLVFGTMLTFMPTVRDYAIDTMYSGVHTSPAPNID